MHYESFFAGVATTLLVMACIWLIRTVRTDPVPEIPQKPRRKYKPRKKLVDQNSMPADPLEAQKFAEQSGVQLRYQE